VWFALHLIQRHLPDPATSFHFSFSFHSDMTRRLRNWICLESGEFMENSCAGEKYLHSCHSSSSLKSEVISDELELDRSGLSSARISHSCLFVRPANAFFFPHCSAAAAQRRMQAQSCKPSDAVHMVPMSLIVQGMLRLGRLVPNSSLGTLVKLSKAVFDPIVSRHRWSLPPI
jgi:hypothetical protein